MKSGSPGEMSIAKDLAEASRESYRRGWSLGTSGNFSSVIGFRPFRLAITPSGANKGKLTAGQIVIVDPFGKAVRGNGLPSEETKLHLAIIRANGAGSVLHTHSVWSTLVSEHWRKKGGVTLQGYEMLKGLNRSYSHEENVRLPILENSQDYDDLAVQIQKLLKNRKKIHGILLRQHGLYTWGENLDEAMRRLEILEFLLEVIGRDETFGIRKSRPS